MAALLLLALTGCTGSVKLSDLDGFGALSSAEWMHTDNRNGGSDQLVLANAGGYCDKYQAFFDENAAFTAAVTGLDPTSDTYCADLEDPLRDYIGAADDLFHEGMYVVALVARTGPGETVPQEGTYEVSGTDLILSGGVSHVTSSAYADVLDDFDPNGSPADSCGIDTSALGDIAYEEWALSDGTLEVSKVTEEKSLSADLDGSLIDDGGADAGTISASFTASYCTVDVPE